MAQAGKDSIDINLNTEPDLKGQSSSVPGVYRDFQLTPEPKPV